MSDSFETTKNSPSDSLESLLTDREHNSPINLAAYGRAMAEKLGTPEQWADNLYKSFENCNNAAAKASFANHINNWIRFLAEQQPPTLAAADLTDKQLAQALDRLSYLRDELQTDHRQSDTFGVG